MKQDEVRRKKDEENARKLENGSRKQDELERIRMEARFAKKEIKRSIEREKRAAEEKKRIEEEKRVKEEERKMNERFDEAYKEFLVKRSSTPILSDDEIKLPRLSNSIENDGVGSLPVSLFLPNLVSSDGNQSSLSDLSRDSSNSLSLTQTLDASKQNPSFIQADEVLPSSSDLSSNNYKSQAFTQTNILPLPNVASNNGKKRPFSAEPFWLPNLFSNDDKRQSGGETRDASQQNPSFIRTGVSPLSNVVRNDGKKRPSLVETFRLPNLISGGSGDASREQIIDASPQKTNVTNNNSNNPSFTQTNILPLPNVASNNGKKRPFSAETFPSSNLFSNDDKHQSGGETRDASQQKQRGQGGQRQRSGTGIGGK
ncbi:hypothetical protein FACS1894152_2970 [Bacilli bacterium]|nr:hypothetical protein FACS1894152_2970 [Bacilli bacterium]